MSLLFKLPGDTLIDLDKVVAIEAPKHGLSAERNGVKSVEEIFTTDPAILDLKEVYGFRILMDGGHVVSVINHSDEWEETRKVWGSVWKKLTQYRSFAKEE